MLLKNEIFWYKNLMKGCNDLKSYWLPNDYNLSNNYSFVEDLFNYWRSEVSSPERTPCLSRRRLDGYGLPTGTDVIEEQSARSEERIQKAANYSTPDLKWESFHLNSFLFSRYANDRQNTFLGVNPFAVSTQIANTLMGCGIWKMIVITTMGWIDVYHWDYNL